MMRHAGTLISRRPGQAIRRCLACLWSIEALALRPGQRFYCQYDFGDNWQFHGRLHQIPARVGPALWAHARLTDTPAAQYAAWGKAPDQYPHAERW